MFCPSPANSCEDAWPLWITKQYRGEVPSTFSAERQGKSLPTWIVWQPELKVRWVCEDCNNGWMSRLEGRAQPFIQPLLDGKAQFVEADAQAIIALWAIKSTMVLEGLGPADQRFYTDQERGNVRSLSVVPRRTYVWMSASIDRAVFMSTKTRHFDESIHSEPSAVCTTIGLSHLVFQVLTLRLPPEVPDSTTIRTSVRRGPWAEATIQLWPPSAVTLSWPPSTGLDGESGLDAVAERFTTRGLVDSELQPLSI